MEEDGLIPDTVRAIIAKERTNHPTVLQISDLHKDSKSYKCQFSDGCKSVPGFITPKLTSRMAEGCIENGGMMRVLEYVCNEIENTGPMLGVFEFEVVSKTRPENVDVKKEPLAVKMEGSAENVGQSGTPQAKRAKPGAKENVGPYKTPAAKLAARASGTPEFTPPSTGRRSAQPIQALNPYNNQWTIKARVSSKSAIRSISRNGQSYSIFSITLVDEQGTEIEATLWRELADQFYDTISEGKVYLISKGRVKPANRAYASARNDYSIDLGSESTIEECPDEDPDKMKAKVCYVRLDALANRVGKKMLVDVIAVAKEVQPLGSVKRKSDGADLARRDLVLVDQSGKMAKLTIWGSMAETEGAELEALEHPVVSVTSVRVGDYDGVSLSSVGRSVVQINPSSPEAESLQSWWSTEGHCQEFSHAGEGLASARKSGEGRSSEKMLLSSVVKDQLSLPPPDAKPEFFNVRACVMKIDPDQNLFYTADAATGKKVVQNNGQWRLAADDSVCNHMERRYFLRISLMDMSGSCDIVLNNEQGENLLGRKAEDLFELREGKQPEFSAVLSAAQFSERSMMLRSNTSEYKGELRQRVQGCGRLLQDDLVAESKWLIAKIKSLQAIA